MEWAIMRLLASLVLCCVILAPPAWAHGGGLDGYGCHHDRELGGYHCHRGPLAGQSFSSKTEAIGALQETRPEATPKAGGCCKICRKGKACGNSCIRASYTCRKPPGCACKG